MLELISFDLDDTLWDAGPVLLRAEATQYAWLGEHLPRITEAHDVHELQLMRRALARERPELAHDFTQLRTVALEHLCKQYDYPQSRVPEAIGIFLDARSTVELFGEVDAVLKALARRYRLAALTNGNTDLERAGVKHYFEFTLSPAETGTAKPDPRMFIALLACAGVAADATVHVGDEPRDDIQGAHDAGIQSVWVNRNARAWPAEYRRAVAEIPTLDALPGVLEQLAASTATKRSPRP